MPPLPTTSPGAQAHRAFAPPSAGAFAQAHPVPTPRGQPAIQSSQVGEIRPVSQTSRPSQTRHASPTNDVAREHAVLVNRLARLQTQVGQLISSHDSQLRHWQQQLLRQSARLLVERTRGHWGLLAVEPELASEWGSEWVPEPGRGPGPGHGPGHDPAHERGGAWRAAVAEAHTQATLCQTGCVMDGHHWRAGDQCTRTGQVCVLPADEQVATE